MYKKHKSVSASSVRQVRLPQNSAGRPVASSRIEKTRVLQTAKQNTVILLVSYRGNLEVLHRRILPIFP